MSHGMEVAIRKHTKQLIRSRYTKGCDSYRKVFLVNQNSRSVLFQQCS